MAPLTVFCARSSGATGVNTVQQQHDWLRQRLELDTIPDLVRSWGLRDPEIVTIVRSGNKRISSATFEQMRALLQRCKDERRPFELVINGFAGFNCRVGEWPRMFQEFVGAVDMTLIAYVGVPRRFAICSMADFLVLAAGGSHDDNDDDSSTNALMNSAAGEFYKYIVAEFTVRQDLSEVHQMLSDIDGKMRNTPK